LSQLFEAQQAYAGFRFVGWAFIGPARFSFSERRWIMSKFFKTGSMVAVVVALSAATASAQSYLDGSSKARGDFGTGSRGAVMQSRPMYQAAPSTQRSFSYEPAPRADQPSQNAKSGSAKVDSKAPMTAPKADMRKETRTYRSFSNEPGTSGGTMRSRASSQTPTYLLPKSDSRKFSGG
jgi:hypothetical protein